MRQKEEQKSDQNDACEEKQSESERESENGRNKKKPNDEEKI